MPFDLRSNPILTEKTPAHLGFNAFQAETMHLAFGRKSSRNLTIWVSYILAMIESSYASTN